jgi:hypothetical protein
MSELDPDRYNEASRLLEKKSDLRTGQGKDLYQNFVMMCIAFSLNHGAVVSCLAYAAAELGNDLGSTSSGILYTCYALTALLASKPFVASVGPKYALLAGVTGTLPALYMSRFFVSESVIRLQGTVSTLLVFFSHSSSPPPCRGSFSSYRRPLAVSLAAFFGPRRAPTSAGAALRAFAFPTTVAAGARQGGQAGGGAGGRNAALYAERACVSAEDTNSSFASIFATVYLALEMALKARPVPAARSERAHPQTDK